MTTEGEYITITKDEAKNLANVNSGIVFIPSIEEFFNLKYTYRIVPDTDKYRRMIRNKTIKYGVLNDGTRVVKKYGLWVSKINNDCIIYPKEHPEIENGTLMTEDEWIKKRESIKKIDGPKNE